MVKQHVAILNIPETESFIYASTHLGSKSCPEKPDYSRGYVWKLYPDFDIFKASLNNDDITVNQQPATSDAEATYAF